MTKLHGPLLLPFLAGLAYCFLTFLGMPIGLMLLTFLIGLAIAGPAKWGRWSIAFVIASALIGGAAALLLPMVPKEGVISGVVACGIMPLIPAFLFWLAIQLRGRNAGGSNAR